MSGNAPVFKYRISVGAYATYMWFDVIPLNEWTMLTIVLTETGVKIYTNGEEDDSTTWDSVPFHVNNLIIWSGDDPHQDLTNGRMDEFGIWNRTLNQTEINALYNNGNGITYVQVLPTPPLDTCSCPGLNNDWEIDMSDYCNITINCDLGTGYLNFTGNGTTRCNATIETTNLGDPQSTGLLEILDDCIIYIS